MVVDYTITVGNIIEIGAIIGGGLSVFLTLKSNVATLKEDVIALQAELKEFGKVLILTARFDEKLANLDRRVTAQGRRIDELSHGEGFVRGGGGIDREYP